MADNSKTKPEFSRPLKMRSLQPSDKHEFAETPTHEEMTSMAAMLGAISIRKMRFTGELHPHGDEGWELLGLLGATITQECILTLSPVRTRIDVDVRRLYLPDLVDSDEEEVEIPEDDEIEPLRGEIDLGVIAMEALALAMPEYPKIEGAELENAAITPPNTAPLEDEVVKPFAGLAALKEKMTGKG